MQYKQETDGDEAEIEEEEKTRFLVKQENKKMQESQTFLRAFLAFCHTQVSHFTHSPTHRHTHTT